MARRGWRIAGKVVGYSLLSIASLVMLVIATVFIGVRTAPGERLLVRIGLYFAAKHLAAPITVGGMHTNLWSGIELTDVTMRDIEGEECAHIDRLLVKLSVWPLLHDGLKVDSLMLEGGRARVRSLKDGRINFAALLEPREPHRPAPDAPASKFRIEINNVKAQVEGRYEPAPGIALQPVAGLIDVAGAVGIGGGDVTVKVAGLSVNLRGPAPALATANGELVVHDGHVRFAPTHVDVELHGSALKAFMTQPELRGKYHLLADARGPLEHLAIEATLLTPSQPIHVDGALLIAETFGWEAHVETNELDPEKLMVGVPPAFVSLDAKGHGDSAGTHVAVASSRIVADRNEVRATGSVESEKSLHTDLAVDIDAKDLSTLHGRGVPKLAGVVAGHARVRYSPAGLKLDTDLRGNGLELPHLRVGTFKITAHTENVSGQVVIEANDVRTDDLSLAYTRVQANGDKRSFFVRASSSGADGTSLDFAAHGSPHYGEGPLPTGVDARFEVFDLDRRGERWHLDPSATLVYDDVLKVSDLRLRSLHQAVCIDGVLDLPHRRVSARVNATGLDLQRLVALVANPENVPSSKLDVAITAEGPLEKPRVDAKVSGTVTRDPARKETEGRVQLEAHLGAQRLLAKSEITLEKNLLSFAVDMPAEFSLATLLKSTAQIRVNVTANVPQLSRLYELLALRPPREIAALDGQLGLSLAVSGTGRVPALHVDLDGEELKYAGVERGKLRLSTHYEDQHLESTVRVDLGGKIGGKQHGVVQLKASLPLVLAKLLDDTLPLRDRVGRSTPLEAELSVEQLWLARLSEFSSSIPHVTDEGTVDAKLTLSGTIGDPVASLRLTAKDVQLGTLDHIQVEMEAYSAKANTKLSADVTIEQSHLLMLRATAGLDVGTSLDGARVQATPIDATVTFPDGDLARFVSLVPGLGGKLSGELRVFGTPTAPVALAHLAIANLGIGATHFGAFDVRGKYKDAAAELSVDAKESTGGSLALRAKLGLGEEHMVVAQLTATAFQLDFVSMMDTFVLRRLKGQLDADLSITGPLASLTSKGTFGFSRGVFAISADAREFSGLELKLALQAGLLRLEKLSGKLGSGRFDATGSATLVGMIPQTVDLVAHTEQLPVVQNPVSASLDSKITIHGERKENGMTGNILIEDASARLPKLTNIRNLQSTGDLDDFVYVDRKARAEQKRKEEADRDPLLVEIETVIPGPFHVRSQEIQLDLAGKLVLKTRGSVVSLRGDIESLGGRMDLLGKRYEIERIRVAFDGSPVINPLLEVKATRQLADARITIEVSGSASRPKLRLSSDNPTYDDSKIIAAILSGDPGAKVTDKSLDKKVTGAISGLVVGAIKDQIAPQLPIDVIKVDTAGDDQTGLSSTRLEIGKFLSDNIYVSYAHQFGTTQFGSRKINANEGEFEYRFLRHFALDLVLGDAPSGRSDLFWTLHF